MYESFSIAEIGEEKCGGAFSGCPEHARDFSGDILLSH